MSLLAAVHSCQLPWHWRDSHYFRPVSHMVHSKSSSCPDFWVTNIGLWRMISAKLVTLSWALLGKQTVVLVLGSLWETNSYAILAPLQCSMVWVKGHLQECTTATMRTLTSLKLSWATAAIAPIFLRNFKSNAIKHSKLYYFYVWTFIIPRYNYKHSHKY